MYDPSIGRWLEEDPLGFEAGDANLYRYVGNGPTDGVDPSGLKEPNAGLPNGGQPINNKPQGTLDAALDFLDYFSHTIVDKPLLTNPRGHPVANTKPISPRPTANTVGGTHCFFIKPKPGEYVGSGGSGPSVSCIIVCPDGNGCVFHFGTGESDVWGTITQYSWAPDSQAVVFGGDNSTPSNTLLDDVLFACTWVCGQSGSKVSYADFEDVYLGAGGQFYHGKPSTNKK